MGEETDISIEPATDIYVERLQAWRFLREVRRVSGLRLGRTGRGHQVLPEDLTRRAIAEAAPRGVVEPVGQPAGGARASASGGLSRGRKRRARPFRFSTPPFCQGLCGSQK